MAPHSPSSSSRLTSLESKCILYIRYTKEEKMSRDAFWYWLSFAVLATGATASLATALTLDALYKIDDETGVLLIAGGSLLSFVLSILIIFRRCS